MTRIKKSIEIKSSPEKVFAVLDDSPNFPQWQEGIKEVKITSNGGKRLEDHTGETAHFVMGFGGFKFEADFKVMKWIKNRLFVIESISGMKLNGEDIVEPIEGGTRVTWDFEYEIPFSLIGKVVDKLLFQKMLEKQMGQNLKNLKKLLEKHEQ